MTDKLAAIFGTMLIRLTVQEPVMAVTTPIPIPETATMRLFGLGVTGAFVARN